MPASLFAESTCFALLDDCTATADNPSSRLYLQHCGTLSCASAEEFNTLLAELESALTQGMHAVGVFTYELGKHLQELTGEAKGGAALAHILLFRECRRLSSQQVLAWLDQQTDGDCSISESVHAGVVRTRPDITESEFASALERIHAYIEAGDTYQVNYTYRIHFQAYGPMAALYARLRKRQPVPYGALIAMPDGRTVLSLSPELFIRHENGLLTARPMKGTAPATATESQDRECAARLAQDPKNRAENLMIVDLLRNDLGRIAESGSVRVPALFDVARHGSVLQMTSTITADLRRQVSLAELLRAVYPCGSITGAPKHRSMQVIDELESAPRGFYTGAIGWFDPHEDKHPVANFCLSVPIRTLVVDPPRENGMRHGEMGVGAGIVHDSDTAGEYAECRLKAGFLTGLTPGFELFETMHARREEGCRHRDLHLKRLAASAAYFGFFYDESRIRGMLADACARLDAGLAYRLRLSLDHAGRCTVQTAALAPLNLPVRIMLAAERTDATDIFLRHKSSAREHYDRAWRTAEARGAFDMLFCNCEGELTEGARSNLFVKLQGRWCTPPLAAGLLPGVMRTVLLSDPAWNASERRLTPDDLRNAEDVVICNALRGALAASIVWPEEYGS